LDSRKHLKDQAAAAALALVEPGMRLGLGTGSTAAAFVGRLGARVRGGFDVVGVPTSEATAALARECGIRLVDLEDVDGLDLAVDGADEIDPALNLIKGGGGALLREKIVAADAARMVVIADADKLVGALGAFALPVEVVPFGLGATRRRIAAALAQLGLTAAARRRTTADGAAFVTDGGHAIIDLALGRIPDPAALARALSAVPGVVEHGLFVGMADLAIIAGESGVQTLARPRNP
jgi:ribose 5-phosphate isomerase A